MAITQIPSEFIAINAISGTIIADNAVTSVHIAQNAILPQHIDDGQVGTSQLAADAVTGAKLDNNIQVAGTFGVTGATTLSSTLAVTGTSTLTGNTTITGDLTVNGTTVTVNSATLTVDDKNIEMGSVASPSDTTADGGGITLKGATDKTIIWENDTNQWNVNQKWTENAGSSAFHRPLTNALFFGN